MVRRGNSSIASTEAQPGRRFRHVWRLISASALLTIATGVGPAATNPEANAPSAKDSSHAGKPASKPASKPSATKPVDPKPSHSDPSAQSPSTSQPRAGSDQTSEQRDHSKPSHPRGQAATADHDSISAEQALKLLEEGNARWVKDTTETPNTGVDRRRDTAEHGQKPFVTVLSCADSRLPVERIFDRGVGEIFVVRVAGNVVAPQLAGTIEYGLEHLHTPLLVVMGHTKCGAVGAAAGGGHIGGNIQSLVDTITPAVERARKTLPADAEGDTLLSAAIRENVWQSIFDLYKSSRPVREMVIHDKIKVVGAVYDISSGMVEWLGEHPWQDAILTALDERGTGTAPAMSTTQVSDSPEH